ncbi:hypothetical protein ACWIEX_17180 [Bosea sp. NPDC055353]
MANLVLTFALACGLSTLAAAAAKSFEPRPEADSASVCDDLDDAPTDAFGFTDGSGIADLGRGSVGLTLGGNAGVREGRSLSRNGTLQGSYGLLPCLEISASLFGGTTRSTIARERLKDRSHGGSFEAKYRLLSHRDHGLGLSLGVETGLERNDDRLAGRFSSYNTAFKLLADRIIVPGTLYGAVNLSHNLTWNGPEPYQRSATTAIGASLAWQFRDGFYLSGEIRHLRQQNSLGLGNHAGHATFIGPGIYWQATEELAISLAYNVQIAGHERGRDRPLDLTNFSRHLVQIDIGWSF